MSRTRHQLDLYDADGRRLNVVWSRSGKSVGVAAILSAPWRFAQVGMHADQVDVLARFLIDSQPTKRGAMDAPEPMIELPDPDHETGRLHAVWHPRGHRMTLTIVPWTPWDGALPEIRLNADQAGTLANFLSAGPPATS